MIAAILRAWLGDAAFATEGNLNNHIGVPLTLLRLRRDAPACGVVELGMNHPGEIALLAGIAAPTRGAGQQRAARAPGVHGQRRGRGARERRVDRGAGAQGTAVFPADDAFTPLWRQLAGARRVLTFALQAPADVVAEYSWQASHWAVQLHTPAGDAAFALRVAGAHNVKNALAAATAALAAGCRCAAVVRGLEAFEPVKGRSQLHRRVWRGAALTLVDDSYNANPDSVRAAIDVLAALPGPRWLVLGDMGEVGEQGPAFHAEVGAYARQRGIEQLWTVGELCAHAASAYGAAARHFDSVDAARRARPGAGRRFGAGQGLALHEDGAGGAGAAAGEWPCCLAWPVAARAVPRRFGFLRVFQYLTFRAVMAAMTALLIGLGFGPWVIRRLTALKIGQPIRDYGMQSHLAKSGTPTMGGVLILIGIGVSTLLWFDWSNRFVWIVHARDLRLRRHRLGRRLAQGGAEEPRRHALAREVLLAVADRPGGGAVPGLQRVRDLEPARAGALPRWVESGFSNDLPPKADLMVPFFKTISYPLGVFGFIALTYFVIVGASNAVNLTDGLDGLAIMPVVMVGSALGIFAYVTGSSVYSRYLLFPYIPGAGELLIFCAAMAGAGLAFLWFNAHPAQVFMGDVGALALGGALGTIAVITRQEIVLGIMGGIFVVEALSVMAQVAWFKYTRKRYGEGRRILKMAPLHHHFEKSGWTETQVVVRFWIITMLLCLVGLAALKLR